MLIPQPVESKKAPSLVLLVPLTTHPLYTFKALPDLYSRSFAQLLEHILSIPLLPNRLPLTALTTFSARLPISSIHVVSPSQLVASLSSVDSRIHLLANLSAFVPPRYSKQPGLPTSALTAYIRILIAIVNSVPVGSLDQSPPSTAPTIGKHAFDAGSDSEDEGPRVVSVSSFAPPPEPLPAVDSRTLKRLQTIPTMSHLNAILVATQHQQSTRPLIYEFLLAVCAAWPSRSTEILSAVVTSTNGGMVRELYKTYVRGSPLGRDDTTATLMGTSWCVFFISSLLTLPPDPIHAPSWPPLVFLVDLYTQSLVTMGDDEFFSSAAAGPQSARNPLSLDELSSFSRQLLNIAFTLYWREDQTNVQQGSVPGVHLRWEGLREKVTKCLQAIHARE